MVERMLAWRFLIKSTKRGRISPMTCFAWAAIAVGVWAMSSFLSVMYGLETSLKSKLLRAYPHVIVKTRRGSQPFRNYDKWTDRLAKAEGVRRIMPFLANEMIVQAPRRTLGGVVWGIPEGDFSYLSGEVVEGKTPDLSSRVPEILMGRELGHRLGLYVGQEVRLISPIKSGGAMGAVPRSAVYRVSGFYASGHYEFDQEYLFLVMEDAQDLQRVGDAISGWHLWGADYDAADDLQGAVAALIPEQWEAESWTSFNSALFQSLKLEQYSMYVILSFAIAIAVMNIVITLMMHVTQKRKNIGILRALGASQKQIRRVFVWQGFLLGAVGLAIGAVFTVGFIFYVKFFSTYQLPEMYYDRSLPIEARASSLVAIYVTAIVMIFLATWYPARKAADVHPIEAIRE